MATHAEFADLANRLISKHGRSITLNKRDRDPADANKPWNGPTNVAADPEDTQTLVAAALQPSSAVQLGITTENSDLVKRSSEILLVAPPSTAAYDLSTFDEVVDGGEVLRITAVEKLKPGTQTIIYFIGVKR